MRRLHEPMASAGVEHPQSLRTSIKVDTYRNYLLILLLVIQTTTYVDSRVLSVVLQSIKIEFALSDTELGLLTGIAFSLFYAAVGLPIARWADTGNRVTIITITTALWSLATALCGAAGNFFQLLAIRVCVAVGEAGCIPPAQSLLADYFTRAERPRAVARYMLAVPIATLIGYFLAGWLSEMYGWRTTFVIVGMPGVLLSTLAWCTLREPRNGPIRIEPDTSVTVQRPARILSDSEHQRGLPPAKSRPTLAVVLRTLWASPTFRHLVIFYSIVSFFGYGVAPWKPAFFARSYGMSPGVLGTWLAVVLGVSGLLGTYFGGEFVARYFGNDERRQLRTIALGYSSFGLVSACIYISPNQYVAFGFMGLAMLGGSTAIGPLFALIQTIVPTHMRAQAVAVIYLFANLIGMGLGPLAVGVLSDAMHPYLGQESLRYALLSMSFGYLWGGWHAWRAARTVLDDLAAVESAEPTPPISASTSRPRMGMTG